MMYSRQYFKEEPFPMLLNRQLFPPQRNEKNECVLSETL